MSDLLPRELCVCVLEEEVMGEWDGGRKRRGWDGKSAGFWNQMLLNLLSLTYWHDPRQVSFLQALVSSAIKWSC